MFSKHVSSLTSAYCHDELSPEQSRRVAEHLISCQRCRAEFEEVKFGARLAAQLPMIEAPDSLWRGIEIALDRAPRIGSDLISDKAKLGIGQWLETDTNSRAQISVSDIGQVEIDPNSRVRLVETKPTEHRLELE